jgi:hypothetical protein
LPPEAHGASWLWQTATGRIRRSDNDLGVGEPGIPDCHAGLNEGTVRADYLP